LLANEDCTILLEEKEYMELNYEDDKHKEERREGVPKNRRYSLFGSDVWEGERGEEIEQIHEGHAGPPANIYYYLI
jgi:hypothetical protein